MVTAATVQVSPDPSKISLRMGPERSVDASREAVSLTGRILECNLGWGGEGTYEDANFEGTDLCNWRAGH